jgi:hypothetical protein
MGAMDEYSMNCDYLRDRFKLDETANIYEFIAKAITEIHKLEDKIVELTEKLKSQKEKKNESGKKRRKSSRSGTK